MKVRTGIGKIALAGSQGGLWKHGDAGSRTEAHRGTDGFATVPTIMRAPHFYPDSFPRDAADQAELLECGGIVGMKLWIVVIIALGSGCSSLDFSPRRLEGDTSSFLIFGGLIFLAGSSVCPGPPEDPAGV
jgi:hypothetical protein